jgi:glyoxylase-like metal-dependent hydrolase (beta-lactamase superfamily II)
MHQLHRRDFFNRLLGAGFAGLSILEQALLRAARARAQSAGMRRSLFEIVQAAEGVYLALARPAVMLNCNAAIFVNERDVLVVDAHSKPSAVTALVAQIRREITTKRVGYVVNSHFHYDHVQGTPAYRRLAPGARVMATAKTRELIEQLSPRRLAASLEGMRRQVEQARERLADTRMPVERSYFERVIAEGDAFLKEMRDWQPELPDITFGEQLVLHDRAHDLHLVFRGRAHTASDICLFCPRKKVLATADLVGGFLPGTGDGFPQEWPATLDRFAELEFEQVLPGHGDLQPDRRRVLDLKGYLEEVNELVAAGRRQGRDLEELQREITVASLHSLQGEYGEHIAANTAKYRLLAPGSTAADSMAGALRANIADAYRAE